MPGEGEFEISADVAEDHERKDDHERAAEREKEIKPQQTHIDILLGQLRDRFTDGEPNPPITVSDGRKLLDAIGKDRKASGKDGDEYADEIEREHAVAEVLRKIEEGEGETDGYTRDELRQLLAYYRDEIDTWAHPVGGTDSKVTHGNQQVYESIFAYAVNRLPVVEAIVPEIPQYTVSDVAAVLEPLKDGITPDSVEACFKKIGKDVVKELQKAKEDPANKEWVQLLEDIAKARQTGRKNGTHVFVLILHPDGTRELQDFDASKKYPPKLDKGKKQYILDFEGIEGARRDYIHDEVEAFPDLGKYVEEAGLTGEDPVSIPVGYNDKIVAILSSMEDATRGTDNFNTVDKLGKYLNPDSAAAEQE